MPLGEKIIVASSVPAELKLISDMLRRAGHTVASETSDMANTLRRTRSLYCDLIVIDGNLDGGKGLKTAEIIKQDELAAVLLLVDNDVFARARNFHYLMRPINYNSFIPAVEAALYYRQRESVLREQIRTLQNTLDTRKLTDKAKGFLIDKMNMSENDAHRFIQKEAMKRSVTLKQVAMEIIDKFDDRKK